MSLPGGPNNQYGADGGGRQYYDPLSGHPLDGASGHDYQQYQGGQSLPGAHVSGNPENSGYQSFSAPGSEPGAGFGPAPQAPPKRSYGPTIAVAATAVLSIIVIITTLVVVKGGDDRANPATSASPSTSSPVPTTDLTPVRPGWQTVPIGDAGVAYDAPPAWETDHEGVTGFENDAGERLTMSSYSTYLEGFCPQASSSYRAVVGVTSIKESNAESAVTTVLRRVARLGWSSPDGTEPRVELDSPQSASLDGGSLEGTFRSGTITPVEQGSCGAPSTYVAAIALPSQQENVVMLGIADQEAIGSVAPERINRSLRSLRMI